MRELRAVTKLTQKQYAARAGLTLSVFRRIEKTGRMSLQEWSQVLRAIPPEPPHPRRRQRR